MWLLNTTTYKLERFDSDTDRPRYAILSHVWTKEEVSFADIQDLNKAKLQKGFTKIERSCALALQDKYRWIWIDTCCIDKTSSAELSEAINSMYAWYGEADLCYAYLHDVKDSNEEDPLADGSSFRSSRWFTRGWTLQELIAPRSMYFLAKNWRRLGTKRSLAHVLRDVTLVDREVLLHDKLLDDVSVARRMSWAARRETTRMEDRAYSLMGIFGVNMPTIYGEGEKAFIRLQLEITRQTPDQSIFAWGRIHNHQVFTDNMHSFSDGSKWTSEYRSLLASSPAMFADSAGVESVPIESFGEHLGLTIPVPEYYPTNYGIHIRLPLYAMNGTPMCFAILACRDRGGMIALLVRRMENSLSRYHVGLHGMYRPLQPPWHPFFRVFRIPSKKNEKKIFLSRLAIADMYLHSHNPNPQKSRALGIANNDLRLHARKSLSNDPPEHFTFIIPGWLLKRLKDEGFRALLEDEKLPSWCPTKAWTQKGQTLTLTMRRIPTKRATKGSSNGSIMGSKEKVVGDIEPGVVVFRGPVREMFALVISVTEHGSVKAEGIIKGCEGPHNDQWEGTGHDIAKKISTKYQETRDGVKGSRSTVDEWRYGVKRFGDLDKRAIKVTFTPWLDEEEMGAIGKGWITYTVGIELGGEAYLEWKKSSSTGVEADSASTYSRIVAPPDYPKGRK